jgi:hypothetical protein
VEEIINNVYCRAARSLLINDNLNLEFHLQQLLPAFFSCAIGPRLDIQGDDTVEAWESVFGRCFRDI